MLQYLGKNKEFRRYRLFRVAGRIYRTTDLAADTADHSVTQSDAHRDRQQDGGVIQSAHDSDLSRLRSHCSHDLPGEFVTPASRYARHDTVQHDSTNHRLSSPSQHGDKLTATPGHLDTAQQHHSSCPSPTNPSSTPAGHTNPPVRSSRHTCCYDCRQSRKPDNYLSWSLSITVDSLQSISRWRHANTVPQFSTTHSLESATWPLTHNSPESNNQLTCHSDVRGAGHTIACYQQSMCQPARWGISWPAISSVWESWDLSER